MRRDVKEKIVKGQVKGLGSNQLLKLRFQYSATVPIHARLNHQIGKSPLYFGAVIIRRGEHSDQESALQSLWLW